MRELFHNPAVQPTHAVYFVGFPRTLEFQLDTWENDSWGLHKIDRNSTHCRVAVRADGSRHNQCSFEWFRNYFLRRGGNKMTTLYLRPENTAYELDESVQQSRNVPCNCTWEIEPFQPDDFQCSRTADENAPGATRTGTGRIAGAPVVNYQSLGEDGTEIELSVAPTEHCEVMAMTITTPGTLGIPSSRWAYRVTSYKPGDPDWTLFRRPPR